MAEMGTKKGRHPDKVLTAVQVRTLQKPGRYADGNGLYLIIEPSGAKRWALRTVVRGKRRDMGLGGLSLVSLAEAREKARTYCKMAREGGDPLAERREARAVIQPSLRPPDRSMPSIRRVGRTRSTSSSGSAPCASTPIRFWAIPGLIKSTPLTS